MASMKETVSFSGILRGEGHEAICTVYATKVSLPGTSAVKYANHSIEKVSKTLPDGTYKLSVHGDTIPVKRREGLWLSAEF